MTKFIDIATDAYQKIGYYSPGEIISDADAELALRIGNDMLDSWSNETLTCFAILTQSLVMQPGIGRYSIGPGGTVNSARPLRLIMGPGAAYMMDTNGNRYGVDVVALDKWNMVTSNTLVDANVPIYLWYDPQMPLGFLNWWPVPNINWTAYWTSYLQLTDFSTLAGTFSFPPGYKKAIQDCLAVELYPYCYKGERPPEIVLEIASKSKGNIKRTNIRENVAGYDSAITGGGRASYNIYTDSGA